MMTALDAGAEDFLVHDDIYEVLTTPSDFSTVREELEKANIKLMVRKYSAYHKTL